MHHSALFNPQRVRRGDRITVCVNAGAGTVRFRLNGVDLGPAFSGLNGWLFPIVLMSGHNGKKRARLADPTPEVGLAEWTSRGSKWGAGSPQQRRVNQEYKRGIPDRSEREYIIGHDVKEL